MNKVIQTEIIKGSSELAPYDAMDKALVTVEELISTQGIKKSEIIEYRTETKTSRFEGYREEYIVKITISWWSAKR